MRTQNKSAAREARAVLDQVAASRARLVEQATGGASRFARLQSRAVRVADRAAVGCDVCWRRARTFRFLSDRAVATCQAHDPRTPPGLRRRLERPDAILGAEVR
jgi:hypothetical protein